MRDLILDKLSKMEDLEQRKMLKDIMTGLFNNLIEYQENSNKVLKERIFSEVEDAEKKYDIYITVSNKSDVDPVSEFLYPFFSEDVLEKKIIMKEIVESVLKKENMKLFTVFMKCDYATSTKINENRRYNGTIITDWGRYPITVRLKRNQVYMSEVSRLYDIFQKNEILWRTINNPYTNKFFDVFLDECEGSIDENEEIKEIVFDLEEYDQYKMIDIVPLWNIKKMNLKSDGFPMPALDRVNFEHVISIKKMGNENGYLVDENEHIFRYIRRTEEDLTIISPEEKAGTWDIIKVSQQKDETVKNTKFEIACNSRKTSFINKYAGKQACLVRTKGEITRIINAFEFSKYFELQDIEVNASAIEQRLTYDMNFFISDDIRIGNDKKNMILKFRQNSAKTFISQDILSFLVSEIQLYFPEYECVGELI